MFYSKKWKSATAVAARPSRILRRFKFSVQFWPGREGASKLLFWETANRGSMVNFIFDEISKWRDALIVSMLICQCCDVILWNFKRKRKKKGIFPIPYLSLTLLQFPSTRLPCPNFSRKYRARRILSPRKMNISIIVTLRIVLKRKKEKKIARF